VLGTSGTRLRCTVVSCPTHQTPTFKFYLIQEAELSASVSIVDKLAAAVAFFTASANNRSPFDGIEGAGLRRVLKGISKTFAVPSVPKKPLTRDNIKLMLEVAVQPGALFALKRAVTLTALCFKQMLRISEAVAIKGSDVTFDSLKSTYIFKVRKAKNHSDGLSFTIPVDIGHPHCVGNYLRVYMAGIGLRTGDKHAYLACKASRGTGGSWFANIKGGISTYTARAGFKDAVRAIGLELKLYCTHLAKRRAATEAVKAGNTDAMVTIAGRWKSPLHMSVTTKMFMLALLRLSLLDFISHFHLSFLHINIRVFVRSIKGGLFIFTILYFIFIFVSVRRVRAPVHQAHVRLHWVRGRLPRVHRRLHQAPVGLLQALCRPRQTRLRQEQHRL
jgi:integrase